MPSTSHPFYHLLTMFRMNVLLL